MPSLVLHRSLGLTAAALLVVTAVSAQEPVYVHIRNLADSSVDTPAGMGLLPLAAAEAEIAAQHSFLAAGDPTSLAGMRRHAGHVLHALDPTLVPGGPGLGYGIKRAAAEATQHLELALASEGISENVTVHGAHIAAALADVVQWTGEAIDLAQRLQLVTRVSEGASLATRLDGLCRAILYGRDADGDGRVGWQEGESGLAQAIQHMNLLERGEGLTH